MVTSFKHNNDMRQAYGQRAAVHLYLFHDVVWVYEIKLSLMSKNNKSPDYVSERCQFYHFVKEAAHW